MDSDHPPNYNQPFPIMQNLQDHDPAQGHAFLGSVIQYPHLHSSGYGWWNQAANTANMGIYYSPHHYYWTNLAMDANSYAHWSHYHHWFLRLNGDRLVMMAKDHRGSRFLRWKIDEGRPEGIHKILFFVKGHLHDLMKDPYGNYLVQKIFEAHSVSVEQIDDILPYIIGDVQMFKHVCMDSLGSLTVQKMLINLRTQNQISAVINVMKSFTVELIKNLYGSYVIRDCVKLSSPEDKMIILHEVAENCVVIATDRYGSFVIRSCLADAEEEAADKLIPAIISNAAVLTEDQCGNYVVQFLIKMEKMGPSAIEQIIEGLRGKYVELSMNKFATNVVQALLQFSKPQDAATIVQEIMISPEFLNVVQHPFGNYVVQRALQYTEGTLQRSLSDVILSNHRNLFSHVYGRNVLACAKRCRVHV